MKREVEYKIVEVSISLFRDTGLGTAQLNELGKDGWVLAAIGPNSWRYIFWRFKPSAAGV